MPEGDAVLGGLAVRGDELLVVATHRAVDTVRRYDAPTAARSAPSTGSATSSPSPG